MKTRNLLILAVLVLAAVAAVLTLPLLAGDKDQPKEEPARQEAPADAESAAPAEAGTLTRVESVKVCMINDALFPNDQIPVEVEGKTYYGCCPMCKERLTQDAASRMAIDPQTGAEVDKATAVIAARPDGSVLYFESAESLERYREKTSDGGSGGGR